MKKLAIIALLALSALNVNAQVKAKYGWINSSELLDIMPERKKAAVSIDSMVKAEESIIKILNDDYESKLKKLNTEAAKMTPDQLARAKDELAKIEDAIYMQTQGARDKVQKRSRNCLTLC
ncbi:MAG: hypothetical protein M0D57_05765 [Sphingobacteriales bacterium JAD_PAG50586_3]|nr:MAG: hypothetical protein M0D57_05765 [Sphingobacteriales bacterium JAD_PAG50586_3]